MEWLLSPIDASRLHDVGGLVAWHGRFMVLAWGILFPLGIMIARFYKVTLHQNWPEELDKQSWWYWHLGLQLTGGVIMLAGLALILYLLQLRGNPWFDFEGYLESYNTHALLGWVVVGFVVLQFLAGWLRGSKGGPTEPAVHGDHYDMTRRRRVFEYLHKYLGYVLILVSVAAVLTGLWQANAPVWMWLVLVVWWICLLSTFIVLQCRGYALDTYQAIWGVDKSHPGNNLKPIGWGVKRYPRLDD